MAILPYNFENQAITAAGLAAAFRALLADGPLHGCAVGFDGTTVSIAPGRIIIGGYVFRLSAAAVVDVPTTESTASVVVRLDLSKPSTAGSFEQIELRAEAGDYTPVRSDLDAGTGNVYELILARVTIADAAITAVSYTAPSAHRASHIGTAEPGAGLGVYGDIYLKYSE